jgi:hypothetical protein
MEERVTDAEALLSEMTAEAEARRVRILELQDTMEAQIATVRLELGGELERQKALAAARQAQRDELSAQHAELRERAQVLAKDNQALREHVECSRATATQAAEREAELKDRVSALHEQAQRSASVRLCFRAYVWILW